MGTKKAGPIPPILTDLEEARPAETLPEGFFDLDWREKSFCSMIAENNPRSTDKTFFDESRSFGVSKATCTVCPVKYECLIWALMYKEEGVWGSTDEQDRASFMKAHPSYIDSLTKKARALKKFRPIPPAGEILESIRSVFV